MLACMCACICGCMCTCIAFCAPLRDTDIGSCACCCDFVRRHCSIQNGAKDWHCVCVFFVDTKDTNVHFSSYSALQVYHACVHVCYVDLWAVSDFMWITTCFLCLAKRAEKGRGEGLRRGRCRCFVFFYFLHVHEQLWALNFTFRTLTQHTYWHTVLNRKKLKAVVYQLFILALKLCRQGKKDKIQNVQMCKLPQSFPTCREYGMVRNAGQLAVQISLKNHWTRWTN